MIDFTNTSYLKAGSAKQKTVYHMLHSSEILLTLADFTPVLAGTIPITVDTDGSDLDILCYWKHSNQFIQAVLSFDKELEFNYTIKILTDWRQ